MQPRRNYGKRNTPRPVHVPGRGATWAAVGIGILIGLLAVAVMAMLLYGGAP